MPSMTDEKAYTLCVQVLQADVKGNHCEFQCKLMSPGCDYLGTACRIMEDHLYIQCVPQVLENFRINNVKNKRLD